ncbi:MAG TPA: VWA domain-containing protein [Ignavibacteria bacterium]|nr:VWA domain-containing protein [Ignavibacteria bacterium]
MKLIYSKWTDKSLTDEQRLEKLFSLFSYILIQTNGDVQEALDWLSQLDERYSFFDKGLSIQDFIDKLKEKGYIEEDEGMYILKSKGGMRIRQDAFKEIFQNLKKSTDGLHDTAQSGKGVERNNTTKKYQFGDQPSNIDTTQTLYNAFKRDGIDRFSLSEEDIEIYETEQQTTVATVLMLDISHSMILYGEDRITPAKQVALALSELILSKYKKDSLSIVLFGDEAQEVSVSELPFVSVGPYHTNTKAGLELSRHLLRRKKNNNKQIFMITDGKPSAIYESKVNKRLYKNSFGLDPKIINKTLDEAVACRREKITITTFMIADDPYLVRFVQDFTKANNGKAYYSSLNNLGEQVFVDYLKNKSRFED